MKKILSYMTAGIMLFATSCSDDMFDGKLAELPSDGQLEFRYSVPELQGIQTRAIDENAVNTLTLLMFDKDGKLQQVEPLDPTKESCSVTVDAKLRKDKNLSFLMLANAPETYDVAYFEARKNNISKDDVKTLPYKIADATDYLVMSGSASLDDILGFNSVALYRSAAKVSVNKGTKDADGNFVLDSDGMIVLDDDEAMPFAVLGTPVQGSLCSGADSDNSRYILGNTPSSVTMPQTITSTDFVYVHPTKKGTGVYVIVKNNEHDGTDYYYRLDFEEDNLLDLNPNHWYQFVIKDVVGKGFATPAEASQNPTPKSGGGVTWDIIDHSPRVYNIVTDGKNSLGVSNSVTHTGNVTGTATASEYFYVRISNKEGNYNDPEPDLKVADFICGKSWLTIGAITKVEETGEDLATGSTPGRLYKVEAKFSRASEVGSQKTTITVRWNDLSRVIPVVWNREFNADDIVASAVLDVYKDGTNPQSDWRQADYFDFLENNVWGVDADANNGDARDEGFHFPVMYGEDTNNPWTYKYTVTFVNPNDNTYKWRFSVSGESDAVIRNNVQINIISANNDGVVITSPNQAGPQIELTMKKEAGDTYGVGKLIVEVAPNGTDDWKEMPIAIYHTGFFHKDNYDHAVAGTYDNTTKKYTYYGVVKIGDNRWLDRNIGAHSAELYIEKADKNRTPQHGTTAGRGAYFYAAKQNGSEPNLYLNLCPPGYQVPYSTDWDEIRKSSKFTTTNMGSYITAYYASDSKKSDGTVLNIYFSKSRYYDGDKPVGDNCVGYYWSQTTATGFEKAERGRWLKDFVIYGEATQISNARVDYDSTKGFALSLRCVSKHDEKKDNQEAKFFVKGATHVFAYSLNSANERVPVATWPGTPIANYNTAYSDYINYRYLGKTSPEDLFLIFNFKGENGQIYSISKDDTGAKITTNLSPGELIGWRASGDDAPNAGVAVRNAADNGNITSCTKTGVNSTTTSYYWNVNRTDKDKITLTNAEALGYREPVVTWQIHGNIFTGAWDEAGSKKALNKNGSEWSATLAFEHDGYFVIQRLEDGIEKNAYGYTEGSTGVIVLDTPFLCGGSSGQGDKNFYITKGSYLFTYNATTQELIVRAKEKTEFETGDKLQFRWTSDASGIWVGYNEGGSGDNVDGVDWNGSDTKTQNGSGYKYREIVFERSAAKLKYKLKSGQNNDDFVTFDQAKSKYDSTVGAYIINLNNDGTIQ